MRLCMGLLFILGCSVAMPSVAGDIAPTAEILCNEGDGSFQSEFPTGVSLHAGADRADRLAKRTCEATLSWSTHTLSVATQAFQLDVDAFGIDLGLGAPVATFGVKKSADNCCMEFSVYSLEKPPHQLHTITGGDSFITADTDLDGRVEIWTRDAAALKDFEGLSPGELDFASMVLRFERGVPMDVGSEFQPYFDDQIAKLREELDSKEARDFKKSDGKLATTPSLSVEQIHTLRAAKGKVLGIVWAYLYSGRQEEAWSVLHEMWPATDVARIRAAILDARARGIRAQVNGMAVTNTRVRHKRIQVFDARTASGPGKQDITPPTAILLRQPSVAGAPEKGEGESESLLDLVIDSAGKVRSAQLAGKARPVNAPLLTAVSGWKFIPAFKDGKAVACAIRVAVSTKR